MAVKDDFLEGIHEVFSEFFSEEKILLKFLDTEETTTNIYGEPDEEGKKYKDAIKLVGKVNLSPSEGESVVEGIQYSATFKIPTKELILKGIPHSPQDYDTLNKAVIEYEGVEYEITRIKPETNINDCYMFYTFYGDKPKIRRVVE